MKIKQSLAALFTVTTLALSALANAGVDTETDKNGVILAGYDAVAYFTQNAAVEGSSEFTAVHNDAIYRFSSAKNRDLFTANPSKYEPQYGGFCAYGTAAGYKVDGDPKVWNVVDGKLYLNINKSVDRAWDRKQSFYIKKADKSWTKIRNK